MKAIIIDDEPNCVKTLNALLNKYCPQVQVVAFAANGYEGLERIKEHDPAIVFLDVEMPKMNGFEMLQQLPFLNFSLVFTTSYDQYALKAFKFSAIDYLLKPIDRDELKAAVQKIIDHSKKPSTQQVDLLMQKIHNPLKPINKIALPTMEGLQLIPVDSIISCEADDNYTIFYLKNSKKIVVSCTLKEIEEMLEEHSFSRIHRCYLVNINEIERYVKGEGGYVVMSNGASIDVSRTKKESLLKKLLPHKY